MVKQTLSKPPHLYNALTLAYMGDAVYEQYVRLYLLRQGEQNAHQLHRAATRYVSAVAQARAMKRLLASDAVLTDAERDIAKRGRNAKSRTIPKNTSAAAYQLSTAFESVLGYLYLNGEHDRLERCMDQAIAFIEQSEGDG